MQDVKSSFPADAPGTNGATEATELKGDLNQQAESTPCVQVKFVQSDQQ